MHRNVRLALLTMFLLSLIVPGLPAAAHPVDEGADHDPYHGAEPATDSSENMRLLAHVPKRGTVVSDLAFQGNRVYMGNYDGFQIIDVSSPSDPEVLADFVCPAAQNDVSIYRNLLFTSVDRPQTGPDCGATDIEDPADVDPVGSEAGWEGIRIFDVSDPRNPVQVGAVATDCGSHTHTLVPDRGNDRVLIYVSSYSSTPSTFGTSQFGNTCGSTAAGEDMQLDQISVVGVPLDDPASASVVSEPTLDLEPYFGLPADPATDPFADFRGGNGCHDIGVFLEIDRAAGACSGEGLLLDISDRENPVIIDVQDADRVEFYHSGGFSWDGETVIFGDEDGGGGEAKCQLGQEDLGGFSLSPTDDISDVVGFYKLPTAQSATEICVAHNYNSIPVQGRNVLTSAWYLGGTSMVNYNDPSNPFQIGFFDYEQVPGDELTFGGSWSSYWYNGMVFSSTQRGLDIYAFTDDAAAGARPDRRVNPQTQVNLNPAACTMTGTAGDDVLRGTDGQDVICGMGGNDTLYGRGSDDLLLGGDGNDRVYGGDGNDSLSGGTGNDALLGNRGRDIVYGEDGDDHLWGGRFHDLLVGGAGNDDLRGNSGEDSLHAGEGSDTVYGDTGDDQLFGDNGDDLLHGSQGDDTHDGDDGEDRCNGAAGSDVAQNCETYLNTEQQVTEGQFAVFEANTDLTVSGGAELIRMADSTLLRVGVRGLTEGVTYPVHLHNQPCSVDMGGGHYQHDPAGPPMPPNELWASDDPADPTAGVTADSSGGATGEGTAPWRARAEAQSVVIHAPDGTRIACADLV